MMPYQMPTLKTIDEYYGGLDFQEEKRPPKRGLFKNCLGNINVSFLENVIDIGDIEIAVYSQYKYRESCFETFERFVHEFTNVWNANIYNLKHCFENMPAFTLEGYKLKIENNNTFQNKGNVKGTAKSNQIGKVDSEQKNTSSLNQENISKDIESGTHTTNTENTLNTKTDNTTDTDSNARKMYSDTPNNYNGKVDDIKGLTNVTDDNRKDVQESKQNSDQSGTSKNEQEDKIERDFNNSLNTSGTNDLTNLQNSENKQENENETDTLTSGEAENVTTQTHIENRLEKFYKLKALEIDFLGEFVKKFESLFMNTIIIKNNKRWF